MTNTVRFEDLGVRDYLDTWNYQESLMQEMIGNKKNRPAPVVSHNLLFVEHPHVYTLGKSGSENNMLLQRGDLQEKGVTFYRTNRGGDITYHGPGQIVGYPIFDLEAFRISLKDYIFNLEESVILACNELGIDGRRLNGATGVWIDPEIPGRCRKICAIGVRASHYVTMHGFAFNVNTNLAYFNYINPCGFKDKGVTSVQKEKGSEADPEKMKGILKETIRKVFAFSYAG